jgi:hypothetical protein
MPGANVLPWSDFQPVTRKLTAAQRIIRVLSPSVKIFFTLYLNFLSTNPEIFTHPCK